MAAYYNEFNKEAAAWIRELISMGLIADGEVDERSITEVAPSDLTGFTQHHFFAGIGGWSDDRAICSASLPCQPFSLAGKQLGKADERHLLPHFLELVKACNFSTIVGEQVPGAIKQGWLDDLYDEMEREGYTCGSSVLTAAGAGAANIRQRIYWAAIRMGDTQNTYGWPESQQPSGISGEAWDKPRGSGLHNRMGDTEHNGQPAGPFSGSNGETVQNSKTRQDSPGELKGVGSSRALPGEFGGVGDSELHGLHEAENRRSVSESETESRMLELERPDSVDWLYCRDEKYRPIKSGIKPLVDGFPRGVGHSRHTSIQEFESLDPAQKQEALQGANETGEARVMRLMGYGNAIQIDTATAFIKAAMFAMDNFY